MNLCLLFRHHLIPLYLVQGISPYCPNTLTLSILYKRKEEISMTQIHLSSSLYESIDWDNVRGPVSIRMTNDYLFRALLQQNNHVLKALVCSLLHLDEKTIKSVKITNPIELGETVESKNFILDISVELNNYTLINLEMQVINEHNWPERSLCYLCRAFDNLNHGENYQDVKPAIHIGILDFTLFHEEPEFYATYRMMNEKTHKLYSDKLRLSVLDLTQINLATEEDKQNQIDHWAKLFKATTWEELKMLAKSNPNIQEAAATVYKLSQEEKIRQQCEAREDYYRRTAGREQLLKKLSSENEQLVSDNKELSSEIERLRTFIKNNGLNYNDD